MSKYREIIRTKKLSNGRWEATIVVLTDDGNCSKIVESATRTSTSKDQAIEGAENSLRIMRILDTMW